MNKLLKIISRAVAFLWPKPNDEAAPVAQDQPVKELTPADSAEIHRQALEDLGDLPRIAERLKKADPATYDDDYRAKHGL